MWRYADADVVFELLLMFLFVIGFTLSSVSVLLSFYSSFHTVANSCGKASSTQRRLAAVQIVLSGNSFNSKQFEIFR